MNLRQTVFFFFIFVGLFGCSSSQREQPCSSVASYLVPPESDDLYSVMITHIDGKAVLAQAFYALPAGEHKVTVAELVSAPSLVVPLKFRGTKTITIIMDAGSRYHLAAKFNTTLSMPATSADFWRLVVWKQETFSCLIEHTNI